MSSRYDLVPKITIEYKHNANKQFTIRYFQKIQVKNIDLFSFFSDLLKAKKPLSLFKIDSLFICDGKVKTKLSK
jgi:hypothetical protein